jgi:hypothetical protein
VQDRETVDLFHDVPHVYRGCRRASIDDANAMRSEIIWADLREEAVAPRWKELAFKNGAAHRPGAIGHRRRLQPLLAEFAEALRLLEAPLLSLLLDRWGDPLGDRPPCIDAFLARASEKQAVRGVFAKVQPLPPAVQAVVHPERHSALRSDVDIHPVAVRDLVVFTPLVSML